MPAAWDPYLVALLLACLATVAYWILPRQRRRLLSRSATGMVSLTLATGGLLLCAWSALADRPSMTYQRAAHPVAIAVAFDLSPSMLAVPHPDLDGPYPARFERAQALLLDLFRAIEERREAVIVSVLGFSREADILMGWDESTVQVRDILEYAVAPDLLGSSGTSFEAAVSSVNRLFSMLPEDVQAGSRKIAIFVSDGEDTMRSSSFGYATNDIADGGYDVIALQTGLLDREEGIATWDSAGRFDGFRSMSGEVYTVPDAAAMAAIADASSGRGMHLRAEAPEAGQRLLAFTLSGTGGGAALDPGVLSALGLFTVVAVLFGILIR